MIAASILDTAKFRKVHALLKGGSTKGERDAALVQAGKIAARAGMTIDQAVSEMDGPKVAASTDFFAGFDDWMEKKEPGYKAREAQKKAARNSRENVRRAEILNQYGSEAAFFSRNAHEAALDAAIAHMATWDYWTDEDGSSHRFAKTMDGHQPKFISWSLDDITPPIRTAVTSAYLWPSSLDAALLEVKAWDQLRLDRGLFCSHGEYTHYAEVECRIILLEHELEIGRPAASWGDVQARFDWNKYEAERQWIDPTECVDPFLDRLRADITALARSSGNVQAGRRTNADKRAAVLSMLDEQPDLSDREISRRCGVSPQTVNTWRKKVSS